MFLFFPRGLSAYVGRTSKLNGFAKKPKVREAISLLFASCFFCNCGVSEGFHNINPGAPEGFSSGAQRMGFEEPEGF